MKQSRYSNRSFAGRPIRLCPRTWGLTIEYFVYQVPVATLYLNSTATRFKLFPMLMIYIMPFLYMLSRCLLAEPRGRVPALAIAWWVQHFPLFASVAMLAAMIVAHVIPPFASLIVVDALQLITLSIALWALSVSLSSALVVSLIISSIRLALAVGISVGADAKFIHSEGLLWIIVPCFVASLVSRGTLPFIDLLWIRGRLKRSMLRMSVFYWKTSPEEFCHDTQLSAPVVITQAATSVRISAEKTLHGFSLRFSGDKAADIQGLEALNTAACELFERYTTLSTPAPGRNLNSNGVALHSDPIEAQRRSACELLERDAVLAHYYTAKPALIKYDLQRLADEPGKNALGQLGKLCSRFDSSWAFQLYSPIRSMQVYWVVIARGGVAASGWATGEMGDRNVIPKAFSEALCGYRFARLPENARLIDQVSRMTSDSITHESFLGVARELGVTNTDLQCAVLLAADRAGERIAFLGNCNEVPHLETFLARASEQSWYPEPSIRFEAIDQPNSSPYTVLRAISSEAFQVDWPKASIEEITTVARSKGIGRQLSSNAEAPCIVY